MLKILTIVGARPQIIKAAAINRTIKNKYSKDIKEIILHTGQHYDNNMSEIFFNELNIDKPKYNLGVGSDTHSRQTAQMLDGIEGIIKKENPDIVMLYGDTNSTIAGALAAVKLHIPVVHVEAGLRSYNKYMPEEINRITTDHCSTVLFVPTITGINNLKREGFDINSKLPYSVNNPAVFHCGDVMYDNTLFFSDIVDGKSSILEELDLEKEKYILVTIHREDNTNDLERLKNIFEALYSIVEKSGFNIVLPLHPRTMKVINNNPDIKIFKTVKDSCKIKIIPPISFFDMIKLEKYCLMIMTDSGGVQKEAYFFKKKSIILRSETEWVEIVETGNAIIADADKDRIIKAFESIGNSKINNYPNIFGDGHSADFICSKLIYIFNN